MSKDTFPGFPACMRMMRKHDAGTQEDGFHLLIPHAAEHVTELLAEFHRESDPGLRYWLVELLAEARSPELFEFFKSLIYGDDSALRTGGVLGLAKLNTKEARRVLWEARSLTLPDAAEHDWFQRSLNEVVSREIGPKT